MGAAGVLARSCIGFVNQPVLEPFRSFRSCIRAGSQLVDCLSTLRRAQLAHYVAETEQIAFGTGVLVDGLDFSDDKMLQGRTFSYSDTQRYRVGPNYQQLPVNRPKTHVATNQRDGQMASHVDLAPGQDPHVNYEPNGGGGLREAAPGGAPHEPWIEGRLQRKKIARTNDYQQAGERYRTMPAEERDDLVTNLCAALGQCEGPIQEKMVWHFAQCDAEFGGAEAGRRAVNTDPMPTPGGGCSPRAGRSDRMEVTHALP